MATVAAAGRKRSPRGRKPLAAVLDNDVNISAGKADAAAALLSPPQKAKRAGSRRGKLAAAAVQADEPMGTSPAQALDIDAADVSAGNVEPAPASTQKAKRAPSKGGRGKAAAAPSMADELTELQGMMEKLRLEKEKAEEMVRERDEVIRKKEEEIESKGKQQERLQAELKKMQRIKEFKPTMNFPMVQSLLDKDQEGDDKGKKKKNKGKGKAGNERKKPAPAYVLWCKDQWAEIKKESSDADFKEVGNALGAKWKTLTAEEKQPYEERYRQEKEAYLQVVGQEKREAEAMKLLEEEQMRWTAKELLEQYLKFRQEAEEGDSKKNGKKKSKKEKDPSRPKQPMSAYFVYSQERRAALVAEKKNVPEIGKITGGEWKSMTEAQKAPYEDVARKQKEEYQKQMEVYKKNKLQESESLEKEEDEQKKILKHEALQLLKKKEKADNIIKKTKEKRLKKKQENADPNRPKKPASSFLLFSKEARKQLTEERPGVNNSTLNALISVKWKELSGTEKKAWTDKAALGMAVYKTELEEYTKAHSSSPSSSP
ncbi:high mobility group B protein 6 [Lolium perenne]|uniref:high mobility group B protein 6 n=1 Tax=Lolium perenne TaxID=4522 RepID=UPI0021EB482D|nr:high mobility group B protein 6 [Lolium perenne]